MIKVYKRVGSRSVDPQHLGQLNKTLTFGEKMRQKLLGRKIRQKKPVLVGNMIKIF